MITIVRPRGIRGTPTLLAHAVQGQTRYYPNHRRPRAYDYNRDFFMVPVAPNLVANAPPEYVEAFNFFSKNKYGQRLVLRNTGLPVPNTATGVWLQAGSPPEGAKFVVRPLRHAGGEHYRVTDNPLDFAPGSEYISELYPKKREYRIIYVFGQPLIVMRKKPVEGTPEDAPWGHVNSTFQTINDVPACRLSQTDCFTRLAANSVIRGAHIVAVDILYNRDAPQPYVVLEFNNCPGLDIDNNRAKVVEAIRARVH